MALKAVKEDRVAIQDVAATLAISACLLPGFCPRELRGPPNVQMSGETHDGGQPGPSFKRQSLLKVIRFKSRSSAAFSRHPQMERTTSIIPDLFDDVETLPRPVVVLPPCPSVRWHTSGHKARGRTQRSGLSDLRAQSFQSQAQEQEELKKAGAEANIVVARQVRFKVPVSPQLLLGPPTRIKISAPGKHSTLVLGSPCCRQSSRTRSPLLTGPSHKTSKTAETQSRTQPNGDTSNRSCGCVLRISSERPLSLITVAQ